MTEHSELGASGAERWMHCPGSVALIRGFELPESDEPDYRKDGTAAHALAAHCLAEGCDSWEGVGLSFGGEGVIVDPPMAEAVQAYLDECRNVATPGAKVYIEHRISAPEIHAKYFGTLDYGVVLTTPLVIEGDEIDAVVLDYKHGEGLVVEVEGNPQPVYYAYGLIRLHPEIKRLRIGIVQPRITWHPDGTVRWATMTAAEVVAFVLEKIKPAMEATEVDNDLLPGEWCRFCPAKLVCPAMKSLFGAAAQANPSEVIELSDALLGQSWNKIKAVKFYAAALEDEVYRRNNMGKTVPGTKLVNKKANRVWKGDAAQALAVLGPEIFTEPELKSPPDIEKMGAKAKALVKEYAFTPNTGLTVASVGDKRPAVPVHTATETFGAALENLATAAA